MTDKEALNYLKPRLRIFIQCTDDNIALHKAIEALGKQIPKRPQGDLHSVPHYRCPTCNSAVKMFDRSVTYPVCFNCGQKLDWSKDE